ncbi:glucosaminidase domain-containing protein [Labilibaculum sp. DW002]|uniref:Peptidoglycan hydrolase n=1 Tax=Paralabilibaculum antarcticum TaxID=2912572 RepID=A0ABT5VR56_9BACT|nr:MULTISPECIES: glucosaminidase domain-containing protein [unclassified Labilibaculum]MBI9057504.1 glucosaminidase domain-containing protein [Labilibaculum sp.]MDE5417906.1 glucosaminidase domain-containing protein [Labilibaculum sp. DW002]
MKRVCLYILLSFFISSSIFAKGYTRQQYIHKYKDLAIKEMMRTGIPASITLAQGLLESGNGNSQLATKANNHFGIKCHDWTGPSVKMDDDKRNECFRKYDRPYDSYKDHSKFLTTRSRYAFLFKYSSDDYKRWAHGLKKAGYATDPKYAHRLIKIIQESQLYKLDVKGEGQDYKIYKPDGTDLADIDSDLEIDPFGARLEIANGIHYINVRKGDTFFSVEKNLGVNRKKLLKYNDLPKNYILQIGQRLYLHNKRGKAARGYNFHRVKEGDSLYGISQEYGVKLKRLKKFNGVRRNYKVKLGERIWLRSKKR